MPTQYTVYFAAEYRRHAEMLIHATELQRRCPHIGIVSRWILGDHELRSGNQAETDRFQAVFAREDLLDVVNADLMIFFAARPDSPGRARGGRHVEFGVALGQAKPIVLVGDVENIFHHLPWIIKVPTWETARDLLIETPIEAIREMMVLADGTGDQ